MGYLDRILNDGTDKQAWLAARDGGIGASTAKMFAKVESVDKYVAALIKPSSGFVGELMESGNRWEPMILAYLNVPQNLALFHAPDEPGFRATPDGIDPGDPFTLAEVKARHGVIKPNPDAGEWRQLAWQLCVFPEAVRVLFGTATLLRGEDGKWEVRENGYSRLEVARDHPKIIAATAQIVPIAHKVMAALGAAQQAMKEAPF